MAISADTKYSDKLREFIIELTKNIPSDCCYRFEGDEMLFPECIICNQPINIFEDRIYKIKSCADKHSPFHFRCFHEWISYNPGERIVKAKSCCPVCKSSITAGEIRIAE